METLNKIKLLVEQISIDTEKTFRGNHTASIRVRKNAQDLKKIIPQFRKEILIEIREHETEKNRNKILKQKKND